MSETTKSQKSVTATWATNLACKTCGAMVARKFVTQHEQWHERVDPPSGS